MKYAKYRIIELLTFFLKNKLVTGYSLNLTTLQEFSQGQHTPLYCIVHTLQRWSSRSGSIKTRANPLELHWLSSAYNF